MRLVSKLLVGGSAVAAASALVAKMIAKRRQRPRDAAGAMFVGAVDEVELGRGRGAEDAYDPEEIPSEHSEVNELRSKMPFG